MRPLTLIATLVVVLGAFAGIGFAVRSFERHQGLPYHIGVGTRYGHVNPGERDVVSGQALNGKPTTKLLLDAQEAPYERNHWRVIASTSHLGPGGYFAFVVHPRVRTRYKVLSAVDRLTFSRVVAVIVDAAPSRR